MAKHSGDSHLVERLLLHGKPSVTDRYINWELPSLLEQFSLIHQVRTPMLAGEENVTRQKLVDFQDLGSKVAPKPGGTASSLPDTRNRSPTVSEALRVLSRGLAQLADAVDNRTLRPGNPNA